jgi:voltage-gated potassium channel
MGKLVACELADKKLNFVIIENNQDNFAQAEELGYNVFLADATSEETLRKVGVERAKTYISLLPSDAENLFTVLTARELNATLFIITRCFEIQNEKKLSRSGANLVVTPHQLSSRRIVNTVLKPNVVNLMDIVSRAQNLSLSLEEITISEDSEFTGMAIRDSGIRQDFDAMVVAVKRKDHLFFNPSPDIILVPGDILILIGERDKILKIS